MLTDIALFAFSPIGFCLLMLFLGSLLSYLSVTWSRYTLAAGFFVLAVFSMPAVANRLLASLETAYLPIPIEQIQTADYIAVLGGSVEPPISPRILVELGASADRVFHAWRLFQAGKAPVIVVSGGRSYDDTGALSEAYYMKEVLLELGVPDESVVLESLSQNTLENAVNTLGKLIELTALNERKQSLSAIAQEDISHKPPTILLVTSSTHLPRALATFRKAGIKAIPAATDIRHVGAGVSGWGAWVPNALSLSQSSSVLREISAFLMYRLRAWA